MAVATSGPASSRSTGRSSRWCASDALSASEGPTMASTVPLAAESEITSAAVGRRNRSTSTPRLVAASAKALIPPGVVR